MWCRDVVLFGSGVQHVARLHGGHAVRTRGGQPGHAPGIETVGTVPPDGGMVHVIALDLVIGDGEVHVAIPVEIARHAPRGGMGEQPCAVLGRETAAGPVPVNVGIDVPHPVVVVGTDEEIEQAVPVEIHDRHGIHRVAGQQGAPVLAQAVRTVPVDVHEGIVGDPVGGLMAADYQVGVPVPAEVRRPGARAVPDGKRLAPVHAETCRSAPQDEAVVVGDLRDDQVQPAVAIEVDEEDPARVLVDDAFVFQLDTLRAIGVEPIRSAVEGHDIRVVESTEDEVEISVPVQVRATDPVGADRRQAHVRFGPEPPFLVEVHVGPGVPAHRVLGRVGQDQVGQPIVVQITSERLDRAPARDLLSILLREPVGAAVIDVDGDVPHEVPAELVDEYGLRKRVIRGAGQQHPPGVVGLEGMRRRQPVLAPAVHQGFRGVAFRRVGLADYDFGPAVPVQVAHNRVTGVSAWNRRAAVLAEALFRTMIKPRTLLPAVPVPAGHYKVGPAVPVQVARGDGQGVAAGQPERRPRLPPVIERHKEYGTGTGDENVGYGLDSDNGNQRNGGIDVFGIASVLGTRVFGRIWFNRHGR